MNRYEFYKNLISYKENETEDNTLKHYGIIGQKWGTRRWQNQDGTFNEAGKERYFGSNSKNNKAKNEEKKQTNNDEEKIGSLISWQTSMKHKINQGPLHNKMRNNMIKDAIKKRELYDAVNLTDDEIREIAKKIEFPQGDGGDWIHDAQQQFKRESLKYQLEKALNTKFGGKSGNDVSDQKIGSILSKESNLTKSDNEVIKDSLKLNDPNEFKSEDKYNAIKFDKFSDFAKAYGSQLTERWKTIGNDFRKEMKAIKEEDNQNDADIDEEFEGGKIGGVAKDKKKTYKDLKRQGKEAGIGYFDRKRLAKWCIENGIDELTDEIVKGNKDGRKFYDDMLDYEYGTDGQSWGQLEVLHKISKHSKIIDSIESNENVKKFKENSESYKKFEDDYYNYEKQVEKMQKEVVKEMKKFGYNDIPMKTFEINGKKYEKIDTEALRKKDNFSNVFNQISKLVDNTYKTYNDKNKELYKNALLDARKSLGKYEADAQKWAKQYLNSNGERNCPGDYAYAIDTNTKNVRKTYLYERYGYYMTEKMWNELGGP